MSKTQAPRRVSISAAAVYVPCSQKTIRRRIADGSLPGCRFGGKILVDLNDLDRLLRTIPTAEASA